MPIEIPYTFVAGTKAKAKEVNDNFNSITMFVDQLEVSNAELEALVNQISATKAELNGDSNNRFQVADALSNYDAINKHTLTNLTANSRDCISGFIIARQSNTSVNCTPGACWDSTYTAMISSTTSLIKDQSNLQANGKYYVYVTSDKETGNCELVISLSNATPELPTGFEYFRQLGYFTTDDNGYIATVTPLTGNQRVFLFPDYSKAKAISLPYTVTEAGWYDWIASSEQERKFLYIDGEVVGAVSAYGSKDETTQGAMYLVSPGNKITGTTGNINSKFIPAKVIGV